MLRSMGVEQFELRVIQQLLEFMNREHRRDLSPDFFGLDFFFSSSCGAGLGYASDVIHEATIFREHANHTEGITLEDMKLAAQMRVANSVNTPATREVPFSHSFFLLLYFILQWCCFVLLLVRDLNYLRILFNLVLTASDGVSSIEKFHSSSHSFWNWSCSSSNFESREFFVNQFLSLRKVWQKKLLFMIFSS